MNKKGFTLIELLAVTVVLGLMVLMIFPNLLSTIGDVKTRETIILRNRLKEAATVYAENNKNDIIELKKVNGTTYITLGDLVDSGLLDSPIIDPSNDTEIPLPTNIKITRIAGNKFAIEFDVLLPGKPPIITMLGSAEITIFKGDPYTDAGATATSSKDGNLTSSIVKAGNVNTSVIGTYIITYSVTDSYGTTITERRIVNVVILPPPPPMDFAYTGSSQSYNAPIAGRYKLEVWGAQGGFYTSSLGYNASGGRGGYASGEIALNVNEILTIYIGGKGTGGTGGETFAGGYNGGGTGWYAGGGGGATDIRRNGTALTNRIIVAGAGGGSFVSSVTETYHCVSGGGRGGGTSGGSTYSSDCQGVYLVTGGTQTAGGTGSRYNSPGGLGVGGNRSTSAYGVGGGGSGYYGGAGGTSDYCGGGGGSSFIGSLTNGQTIAGNVSMPAPGGGNEVGHAGDGYARITYIGP